MNARALWLALLALVMALAPCSGAPVPVDRLCKPYCKFKVKRGYKWTIVKKFCNEGGNKCYEAGCCVGQDKHGFGGRCEYKPIKCVPKDICQLPPSICHPKFGCKFAKKKCIPKGKCQLPTKCDPSKPEKGGCDFPRKKCDKPPDKCLKATGKCEDETGCIYEPVKCLKPDVKKCEKGPGVCKDGKCVYANKCDERPKHKCYEWVCSWGRCIKKPKHGVPGCLQDDACLKLGDECRPWWPYKKCCRNSFCHNGYCAPLHVKAKADTLAD